MGKTRAAEESEIRLRLPEDIKKEGALLHRHLSPLIISLLLAALVVSSSPKRLDSKDLVPRANHTDKPSYRATIRVSSL